MPTTVPTVATSSQNVSLSPSPSAAAARLRRQWRDCSLRRTRFSPPRIWTRVLFSSVGVTSFVPYRVPLSLALKGGVKKGQWGNREMRAVQMAPEVEGKETAARLYVGGKAAPCGRDGADGARAALSNCLLSVQVSEDVGEDDDEVAHLLNVSHASMSTRPPPDGEADKTHSPARLRLIIPWRRVPDNVAGNAGIRRRCSGNKCK